MISTRILGRVRSGWRLCVVLGLVLAAGCGPRTTCFSIMDHRGDGEPTTYFEEFGTCYYSIDPTGHFDIVAKRTGPGSQDPDERITQVVHLHGIWHAVPGDTYADGTMLNTTVSYLIVDGTGGASFDGAGFVSLFENRSKTIATGKLELAKLAPARRLGAGRQIFERAEVRGEFKAIRDRRQVTRILGEMQRLFGPLPRYTPPTTEPDLL